MNTSVWVTAGAEFTDPSGIPCLPLTLDLNALHPRFAHFVAADRAPALRAEAEHQFHARNETILQNSDSAGEAYVVVTGTVALRTDTGEVLGELGPGARVDGTALPGRAVAIAATNVTLMVATSAQEQHG